jgi:subtilisin family serine protease
MMRPFQTNTQECVKVAMLDTGVDINHPALRKAFSENRIRTCGNLVNALDPLHDSHGHGTQVATLVLKRVSNPILFVARVGVTENAMSLSEGQGAIVQVNPYYIIVT